MPKRVGTVDRSVLVNAPLPEATETYTVISHASVINTTLRLLEEKGFSVQEEIYRCSEGAQQAQGIFKLNYGDDPELGMLFTFVNSYNKSMRFKCAVGGFVKTNGGAIIASDMSSWGRKHTGKSDDETVDTITSQLDNAEAYFKQLLNDKNLMLHVRLTKRQFAELLGVFYVELGVLTGEQLKIVKKEYDKPSFNYSGKPDTLWRIYNHIVVALGKSHPRNWMEQQKLVHLHLTGEYLMNPDFQGVTDNAEEVVVDPNQTSIIDQAEEIQGGPYNYEPDPENPITQVYEDNLPGEPLSEKEIIEADEDGNILATAQMREFDISESEEKPELDPLPIEPSEKDAATAEGIKESHEKVATISGVPPEMAGLKEEPEIKRVLPMAPGAAEAAEMSKPIEERDSFTETKVVTKEELLEDHAHALTEEQFEEMDTEIMLDTKPAAVVEEVEEIPATPTPSVELVESDIFISKQDIGNMFPEAKEGTVVDINDEPYLIIGQDTIEGIDGFYLRATEAPEAEVAEEPKKEHPADVLNNLPNDSLVMDVEVYTEKYGALVMGAVVDIEGYMMEVHSTEDTNVILVPSKPKGEDVGPPEMHTGDAAVGADAKEKPAEESFDISGEEKPGIEPVANLDKPVPIIDPKPLPPFSGAAISLGYDKDMIHKWAEANYDPEAGEAVNLKAFRDWADNAPAEPAAEPEVPFVTDEEEDKLMDQILTPIEQAPKTADASNEGIAKAIEEIPEAGNKETEAVEEPEDEKDNPLRQAISQILYDLYGTIPEYNYEFKEDQYNVTLTTGEVVVLMKEEVDDQIAINS